ncbi:hypothetical protein GCM10011408_18710 [Dyella caseinilytica]|nr:hypothetical protein GCM10011408_18710 [Dyella caseinilytica]
MLAATRLQPRVGAKPVIHPRRRAAANASTGAAIKNRYDITMACAGASRNDAACRHTNVIANSTIIGAAIPLLMQGYLNTCPEGGMHGGVPGLEA